MVSESSLLAFTAVALGMALTPGPNMMYLVSRSVCQGRAAGLVSLAGVALGFVIYLLLSAFGIMAGGQAWRAFAVRGAGAAA